MGVVRSVFIMFTARQKIKKEKGEPTELENQVAQAFVDLEINNEELRPFLKNLHIAGAKEVVVNKSTAAIVISIPYRLKDLFRKNQVRLVRELEKRFLWPARGARGPAQDPGQGVAQVAQGLQGPGPPLLSHPHLGARGDPVGSCVPRQHQRQAYPHAPGW